MPLAGAAVTVIMSAGGRRRSPKCLFLFERLTNSHRNLAVWTRSPDGSDITLAQGVAMATAAATASAAALGWGWPLELWRSPTFVSVAGAVLLCTVTYCLFRNRTHPVSLGHYDAPGARRTFMVTGAGGAIGRSIVNELLRFGSGCHNVVASDVSAASLAAAAAEDGWDTLRSRSDTRRDGDDDGSPRVRCIAFDVSDATGWREAIAVARTMRRWDPAIAAAAAAAAAADGSGVGSDALQPARDAPHGQGGVAPARRRRAASGHGSTGAGPHASGPHSSTAGHDVLHAASAGGLDVLINCAGVSIPQHFQDAPVDDVALQIDVNLKGAALGMHAATQEFLRMRRRTGTVLAGAGETGFNSSGTWTAASTAGDSSPAAVRAAVGVAASATPGHVINIASMAAIAAVPGYAAYTASKFGMRGLTLGTALDLRPIGIYVTCLCPDVVATPQLLRGLEPKHAGGPASISFAGDMITAEEVATCITQRVLPERPVEVWLASQAYRAFFSPLAELFHSSVVMEWTRRRLLRAGVTRAARLRARAAAGEDVLRVTVDAAERRGMGAIAVLLLKVALVAAVAVVVRWLASQVAAELAGAA